MRGYRRLPLEKLHNCRDLGGFATPEGVTKFGVFLRCEVPRDLTPGDIQFLRDYGVTTCLDFRAEEETARIRNDLRDQDFINYISIPMYEQHAAPSGNVANAFADIESFTWQNTYLLMLEYFREWPKRVLEACAAAEGAVLFNCTTGKDRTGLTSMMLLSVAGVPKPDIVADYCTSMVYMKEVYETIDFGGQVPEKFLETPPDAMGDLMDRLEEKYGSVTDYLRSCGITEDTMEAIRRKFVSI